MGVKTDIEYWEKVQAKIPEFMSHTFDECEGWKCGVSAKYALIRFKKYVGEDGDISYITFYRELRALGYDVPTVRGYDAKTRIRGIAYKEGMK